MTPPRAGTFMYHIHSEEADELNAGLYGPLLVLEPGRAHDPAADRTFVLSAGGRGPNPNQTIFVNGSAAPEPIEMAAGVPQRWRFIAIPANGSFDVRITGASGSPSGLPPGAPLWRQVARDGADLPPDQVVRGPARTRIAVGMTMDFEFTPTAPGDLLLQVELLRGPIALAGVATHVPIRVRAASDPAPK
jgi:FtsP/CotA-like multicopper oxidase with cupredoxin domain